MAFGFGSFFALPRGVASLLPLRPRAWPELSVAELAVQLGAKQKRRYPYFWGMPYYPAITREKLLAQIAKTDYWEAAP